MFFADKRIMTQPTVISKNLRLTIFAIHAPKGAARTPPMIKPRIIDQPVMPIKSVKTPDAATATRNSAALTVPIVVLGVFPLLNSVVVTMGPQPPPPLESANPPINPRMGRCTLFSQLLCS